MRDAFLVRAHESKPFAAIMTLDSHCPPYWQDVFRGSRKQCIDFYYKWTRAHKKPRKARKDIGKRRKGSR